MAEHRLEIRIDRDRLERIQAVARAQGISVSRLVQDAIDHEIARSAEVKRSAGRRILDADPMPVPDPDELVRELDDVRSRHA